MALADSTNDPGKGALKIDIPDATMMNSFDSGVYAVPVDIRAPATPMSPVPVSYSDFSLPQMGPLSPGIKQ